MSVSQNFPTIRPTLNIDFANTKILDPRITFTRGSTGTYVDENGVIQSAASGAARFDHDSDGNSLGLLVEESRTNLYKYSEDFSQTEWFKGRTTITTNAATAPDGTLTADDVTETTSSGEHYVNDTFAVTSGITYTVSWFAKANGRTHVYCKFFGDFPNSRGTIDLNTGNFTVLGGTGITDTSWKEYGNGWYRVSFTATASSTGIGQVLLGVAQDALTYNYAGDTNLGMYFWGAQLEEGSFPTSYIPTEGSTVTRAADVASMTGSNFSSWYNQSEGTILWSSRKHVSGGAGAQSKDYFTADNFQLNDNNGSVTLSKSGVGYYYLGPGIALNTKFTTALALKASNYAGSTNGATASSESPLNIAPSSSSINFTPARLISGTISRIAYYPQRLSDTQLQNLTK